MIRTGVKVENFEYTTHIWKIRDKNFFPIISEKHARGSIEQDPVRFKNLCDCCAGFEAYKYGLL